MNLTDLAFLNPLDIPGSMIGGYAGIMKLIAFPVLAALFVVAVIQDQVYMLKGNQSDLRKILWRLVLIFLGLVLYRHIFIKIVAINQIIGMTLCNQSDYAKFQAILTSFAAQKSSITFMKVSVEGLIASVSIFGAVLAETIFGIIRYFILAILYVIGPLALAAAILPGTMGMLKGWFKKVLQVSFWIVILKAIEAIMLSLRMEQMMTPDSGAFSYLIVSGTLLVMICLIPTLSEAILSDGNLGAVASAATGLMTAYGTKAALMSWKGAGLGAKGINAAAAGLAAHPWTQKARSFLESRLPATKKAPATENADTQQPKR